MSSEKHFLIVTGLSGAGKTQALKVFEDMGYFCVDNLPAPLISRFAELMVQSEGNISKACLVMDLRGESFLSGLSESLEVLEKMGIEYEVLFLEASDQVLVQRFKETRRQHPQNPTGDILEGILIERKKLQTLRGMANIIIDTSRLKTNELRQEILNQWKNGHDDFSVSITSFGFKYGNPIDADILMDVRFLKNPYYVPELRPLTGRDQAVRDYIFNQEIAKKFLADYSKLLLELLPQYRKEGKTHLSIDIGCTGGQHRSVAVAVELAKVLEDAGYKISVRHRDN